ncbi:major mite allergen Der p 23-like [Pollicipes pollicipes]|uniref:major mite allergen Der p 23-like n=1 Tax=Pollicipes pollicipes TaxID=41117 RepID=UPI00188508C8|nr:major mite allergen Der p 23-like [Pollicipes pollicipes]XP_037087931.1 major mite allergen Der p 23-like [Pollicipes pollicipes]
MIGRLLTVLCALAAVVLAEGAELGDTMPMEFKCPGEYGLYPDPENCHGFYECNEYYPFHFICPEDLGFDDAAHECNFMPSCK